MEAVERNSWRRGASGVVAVVALVAALTMSPAAGARHTSSHRMGMLEAKVARLARENRQQARQLRGEAGRIAALEREVGCLAELSYLSFQLTWNALNAKSGEQLFPVLPPIARVCARTGAGASGACGLGPSSDLLARSAGSCASNGRKATLELRDALVRRR